MSHVSCRAMVCLLGLVISSHLAGVTAIAEEKQPAARGSVATGKLVKAEQIGVYDATKLNTIVNEELEQFLTGSPMPFEKFKGRFARPTFDVRLYKLTFTSHVPELNDRVVESTGLVAIPETKATELPLLSYQHGTVFEKNQVPSQPENSFETRLLLSQFASRGMS